MTRHGPFVHTAAPSWRRSTGCYMHVAVAPIVTHTNPVGINATGSATWPGSRFHDMPTASYAGLIKRYGKDALFSSVERALLCTSCDRGGPVRLEVHSLPRN